MKKSLLPSTQDNSYWTFDINTKKFLTVTIHNLTSGQDGGIGKQGSPLRTTRAKITIKLQNNYHSEPSENWAVWKPGNQGIKEATCIQMGRRGRDMETGRHGRGWLHTHMWWAKIRMDILGVRNPRPISIHAAQGSSGRKVSPQNFCYKNQWWLRQWQKLQDFQASPLKGPTAHLLRFTPFELQH